MAYCLPNVTDLPPARRMALLLDIDGTLLDFAPTPEGVVIPPALPACLRRLRDRLDGALGFITGRAIDQVDLMLPDIATAIACEHGATIRHGIGEETIRHAPANVPDGWLEQAERACADHPGTGLERKSAGFVLHFRQAPEAGNALRAILDQLVATSERFCVLESKMAWELKARGVDKGAGLRHMMQRKPFLGRIPVFIGDDVTDQDAITAAIEAGGHGFLVHDAFGDPDGVRAWLQNLADTLDASA